MNKEHLKFRAYHKGEDKMYDLTSLVFLRDKIIGGAVKTGALLPVNDVEIDQWTTIKDRKEVEVYTADIIQVKNGDMDLEQQRYVVALEDGAFVTIWEHEDWEHKKYKSVRPLSESRNFEVVGNIYQNKDLLHERL